jgi:hypothetical protein
MNKLIANNVENKLKNIIIIMLAIIAGFIPLVLKFHIEELNGIRFLYWKGQNNHIDIFHYIKSQLVIYSSMIMFIVLIFGISTKKIKIKINKEIMLLIISFMAILLSFVFSKYRKTALIGAIAKYEGAFTLLSYLTIVFSIIIMRPDIKKLKIIIYSIIVSASVMGLIGISQYYGFDIIKTDFIKSIILGKEHIHLLDNFEFSYVKGIIYGTLFNPNFVGSYTVLLLPFSIAFYFSTNKKVLKILTGISSCLIFFTWLGSMSRAGLLGGIIALTIFIILMLRRIKDYSGDFFVLFFAFFNYISDY